MDLSGNFDDLFLESFEWLWCKIPNRKCSNAERSKYKTSKKVEIRGEISYYYFWEIPAKLSRNFPEISKNSSNIRIFSIPASPGCFLFGIL
jgi:hypothetical protein